MDGLNLSRDSRTTFSVTSRTEDWLCALNMAVNQRFPVGIRSYQFKPKLVTDNGCQPSSTRFLAAATALGIKQIFTSQLQ